MEKHGKIAKKLAAVIAMAVMITSLPSGYVSAAHTQYLAAKKTNQSKTNQKKPKWVTKKGYRYYYDETGKKVKGWKQIGKSKYYFDKKGRMLKGWYKINKKFYFLNRKTGKLAVNKKVDAIKVDKNGAAKKAGKNTYNRYKIQTMIRARKLMEKLTKPTQSKSKKRKKCFQYFLSGSNVPYDSSLGALGPVRSKGKKWDLKFANEVFQHGHGDCISMSCAFAYMAHECGYKTVYICDDGDYGQEHAWVEIGGKVFDPLFARTPSKRARSSYYNASYSGTNLHRAKSKNVSTGKTK